jgi:hypothetical protein
MLAPSLAPLQEARCAAVALDRDAVSRRVLTPTATPDPAVIW